MIPLLPNPLPKLELLSWHLLTRPPFPSTASLGHLSHCGHAIPNNNLVSPPHLLLFPASLFYCGFFRFHPENAPDDGPTGNCRGFFKGVSQQTLEAITTRVNDEKFFFFPRVCCNVKDNPTATLSATSESISVQRRSSIYSATNSSPGLLGMVSTHQIGGRIDGPNRHVLPPANVNHTGLLT